MLSQTLKIKKAFPQLPDPWYEVFQERIKNNNFTNERLIDAVDFVIDNCIYPTPTIAQFIQFDKKIKFKTHNQLLELINDYKNIFHEYKPIKINDKIFYVKTGDYNKLSI